jgi:hypothetical protein
MIWLALAVAFVLVCGIVHERRDAARHRAALAAHYRRLDSHAAPCAEVVPIRSEDRAAS